MDTQVVEEKFNEIYDKTYHQCLIYVISKCNHTNVIPDIIQETYLALYQILKNKGHDYIKNPEAYVIRIAKSKIYNHYSLKEKVKSLIPLFDINKEDKEYNQADINSELYENEIEIALENKEVLSAIWRFLQSKPQKVQKVFYLFYYAELSIPEIAQLLHLNQSTIKNHIYRTTHEIRKKFGKDG
ncbi:RNA polymerase sigma factor [Lysinibacillus sp. NPDC097279]|uniref:RNA polymerase sigma factor n=1 Tax=Lysinibacillus sp. NPDC097279 TaxID=3364143 RepID=UPI0037F37521